MKADEIRREFAWDSLEPEYSPLMQVQVLGEIAAQLAELNEARRPVWLEFTWMGREVVLDVSRVGEVYADESKRPQLRLQGEVEGRYVDGTVREVMARIGAARMEGKG
jgi:hypothetical protein